MSLIDRWPWNGREGERLERFGDTRIETIQTPEMHKIARILKKMLIH